MEKHWRYLLRKAAKAGGEGAQLQPSLLPSLIDEFLSYLHQAVSEAGEVDAAATAYCEVRPPNAALPPLLLTPSTALHRASD